jgi:hypothetical protein
MGIHKLFSQEFRIKSTPKVNTNGINRHKGIRLKIGTGHGIIFKPMKEWIDPIVLWVSGRRIQ